MNRKLINGLLLLTVTTGGFGMFTSCKDNEDGFKNEILKGQADIVAALEQKIKDEIAAGKFAKAADLEVVRNKLNALSGKNLLTKENEEYLKDLITNNKDYAAALKLYVDNIVLNLITSVEIQDVVSTAFGRLNTPLGIQSTILGDYYFDNRSEITEGYLEFPKVDPTIAYGDKEAQSFLSDSQIKVKTLKEISDEYLANGVLTNYNLGDIYVTVNPSTVPAESLDGLTINLVNSKGDVFVADLKAVKENDYEIKFGTRADNGFYKLNVKMSPAPEEAEQAEGQNPAKNIEDIRIHISENLKALAKDFVNNPSKSDLAGMADAVIGMFNNKVPALGLEFQSNLPKSFAVNYEEIPNVTNPGYINLSQITDVNGSDYVTTPNENQSDYNSAAPENKKLVFTGIENSPILRSVYSKYALAAVTYHPLSYSFDPSGIIDRRLPEVGHIQGYVNRIFDKLDFNLGLTGIDTKKYNFTLNLDKVNFEIKKTSIEVSLSGTPVYEVKRDNNGEPVKDEKGKYVPDTEKPVGVLGNEAKVTLSYEPGVGAGKPGTGELAGLVDQIVNAVNGDGKEGSGFKGQIAKAVNDQLMSQFNSMIEDLNGQITGIQNKVNSQITDIKKRINDALNGRLGDGANKLIDLYNAFARKFNHLLDNPNAALQIYAAYKDDRGAIHQFSNVESDPTAFTVGSGDGIEMFLTSYNAEILAPAYKKYVAVFDSEGNPATEVNDAEEDLNTILPGNQPSVAIPVKALKKNETYQLIYTALDYSGNVSARRFFITVR